MKPPQLNLGLHLHRYKYDDVGAYNDDYDDYDEYDDYYDGEPLKIFYEKLQKNAAIMEQLNVLSDDQL